MSIADKLQTIQNIKENIKTAINNKGGNVGDDFTQYSTAIDNLSTDGGGKVILPDGTKFRQSNFTTLPEGLDFSNVTDFTETFMDCANLKSVNINTSNAIKFESTFSDCTNLETIGELDCSKLTYINGTVFSNCVNLINLGGFKNIGKSLVGSSFISFAQSRGINRESMLNVFEKLYPIDELSQPKRIVITNVVKNGLTDEDIAIATSKRWVIEVA